MNTPTDYAALTRSARMWALRAGAGDDAEDVAQDALLKLWRREQSGAAWPDEARRYQYLRLCVRSVLADAARRRQTLSAGPALAARSLDTPLGALVAGGNTESDALTRIELHDTLARLRAMGRSGRALVMVASGHSVTDVARCQGVVTWTVYNDCYNARKALQEAA